MSKRMRLPTRVASMDDVAEVARLCTELGYPTTTEDMAERLGVALSAGDRRVFVVDDGTKLLGWISVEWHTSLVTGRKAEIVALVVDPQARRSGAGKALVGAAEAWLRQHGLDEVMVRSNAARVESHPFYEGIGFVRDKTQHVYLKSLA